MKKLVGTRRFVGNHDCDFGHVFRNRKFLEHRAAFLGVILRCSGEERRFEDVPVQLEKEEIIREVKHTITPSHCHSQKTGRTYFKHRLLLAFHPHEGVDDITYDAFTNRAIPSQPVRIDGFQEQSRQALAQGVDQAFLPRVECYEFLRREDQKNNSRQTF